MFNTYMKETYPSGLPKEVETKVRHSFFLAIWATLGIIKKTPGLALANVLNDMADEAGFEIKSSPNEKIVQKILNTNN